MNQTLKNRNQEKKTTLLVAFILFLTCILVDEASASAWNVHLTLKRDTIEDAMVMHPKVADVAVFGVPDTDMGEQVKAVVQPVDGLQGSPSLEAELVAFAREHIAHYKCPKSVDFEAELPRLPTGKLYKRILRDRYWGKTDSRIV